jgi:ribokinase
MVSGKNQIVVVGSHAPGLFLRVKRPPLPGETVIGWNYQEPVDGGKGSNQAIAAARLGGEVSFVGCLGNDRVGDDGARWMTESGVDLTYTRRSSTATGLGFIMLDDNGVPAMVSSLGANAELDSAAVDTALAGLPQARLLLTQFEIDLEVALYAARQARQRGMVSIVNPAPAPDSPIEGLDCADILVPNESEAGLLLGLPLGEAAEPEKLTWQLREMTGAGVVLVTLGDQGVVGCDGEGIWSVSPPPVAVADTSGAGDVFCAALAVALVEGKSIRQASAWACAVAALSVTRPGTIPAYPTRAEADMFIYSSNIVV